MSDARRVALITGAARGIGFGTAKLFAEEGWRVIGADVLDPEANLTGVRWVRTDLREEGDIARVVASVGEAEGRLDALVNNAAVQICKPFWETSSAEWDLVMQINVKAVFLMTREALPLLRGSRGAVVNVSSVHATQTSANILAYATSKGAVATMTRAAALELAPAGLRVNAVLPGAVDTPMLHAGLERDLTDRASRDSHFRAFAQRHPLLRVGEPREIGEAILFLADSRRSSYITGQCLVVDGGATARLSTE